MDSKVEDVIDDPMGAVQEKFGPQIEAAQEQLGELNDQVKDFVRKNPVKVIFGAVALGYLIGKLASRP